MNNGINKALFLDLDDTLITTKSGVTFPTGPDDWQFKEGIVEKVDKYVDDGYLIMIVSNQGGIDKGHVTMNDFRKKIKNITSELMVRTGIQFGRIGYRYCISNNSHDYFRKPNPGMAYDLALAYVIDLSSSLMVGDASGKVKRRETVYMDESSPSKWSYPNGNFVAQVDVKRIEEKGLFGTLVFRDFSDSDLKFAQKAGIPYLDVEDFINQK